MVRIGRAIANSVPFLLAVLAFSFSLKAITSRDWAIQKTYKPSLPMRKWTTPIYTSYRSPFIICDGIQTKVKLSNGSTILTYPLTCIHYKPFGSDRTSCETVATTKKYDLAQVGDTRLCQQIHLTGNLAIAATVFIGLGFLLAIVMTALAFLQSRSLQSSSSSDHSETVVKTKSDREPEPSAAPPRSKSFGVRFGPFFNAALVFCFVAGAIMYVLAQFYGVQAFTMSAPDNGRFAALSGNDLDADGDDHDPWVQGTALTIFASLAWLCSGLAAAMALLVWRLPTAGKTL